MAFLVTMPDGKKFKVSGESVKTPEQAYNYAMRHAEAKQTVDSLPGLIPGVNMGDVRGVAQGAQQAWDNAAMAAEGLANKAKNPSWIDRVPVGIPGVSWGDVRRIATTAANAAGYSTKNDFRSAERAADANAADARRNPSSGLSKFVGNVAGGALITAPLSAVRAPTLAAKYAPRIAAAGARAVQGALGNLAITDPRNTDSATTAATGAVLNVALPPALGGLIGGGRWVGGKMGLLKQPAATAMPKTQSRALQELQKAMRNDNLTPEDVAAGIRQGQELGVPTVMADQGENLARLGGSVTRQPGASRTAMTDFLTERQLDQNPRVQRAINRDLGPTASVRETSENLIDSARKTAGPLYTTALEGGSIAPLEHQFQDAFTASGRGVADAQRALADAQRRVTQAASRQPGASNVYAVSAANRGSRNAASEIEVAQRNLASAQAQHEANLARLRQAQSDGSANAPGAVWSPRIQQFLDDPISKAGLAKGMEVQRIEALAEGRPFNSTEYAVTGTDEAGNPIVASVPNMRTLDAVKRGYDEIIDAYPKSISGKPELDQRGRAIEMARKALVKELDRMNPDYAPARAAYAGPMKLREALQTGKSLVGASADDIRLARRGKSEAELAQMELGYRSGMSEQSSKLVDKADRPQKFTGSADRRDSLGNMFGNNPNLPRFLNTLDAERAAQRTHNIALTGSPSAVNLADDALTGDRSLIGDVGGDVMRVARGGLPRNMLTRGWNRVEDAWKFGVGNTGNNVRMSIADLLTMRDPAALNRALNYIPPPSPFAASVGAGNNLARNYPVLPLIALPAMTGPGDR